MIRTVSTVLTHYYSPKRPSDEANADTFLVGPADAPADKQHLGTSIAGDTSRAAAGDTSGAAHKGTDETRGADEQVTSGR